MVCNTRQLEANRCDVIGAHRQICFSVYSFNLGCIHNNSYMVKLWILHSHSALEGILHHATASKCLCRLVCVMSCLLSFTDLTGNVRYLYRTGLTSYILAKFHFTHLFILISVHFISLYEQNGWFTTLYYEEIKFTSWGGVSRWSEFCLQGQLGNFRIWKSNFSWWI